MEAGTSIIGTILAQGQHAPDKPALIIVHEDGTRQSITHAELEQGILKAAAALQKSGVIPGTLVIIAMKHSAELIFTFLGGLYCGAAPSVYGYLAPRMDPAQHLGRARLMADRLGAGMVVALPEYLPYLQGAACPVVSAAEMALGFDGAPVYSPTEDDDTAYVQYSGGTTGSPKLVAISNRAVLATISRYSQATDISKHGYLTSWSPLYHTMGMFSLLLPVIQNLTIVLISPFHFMRSPGILLRVIQDYGITGGTMPTSGYAHLANSARDEDLTGIDLSSTRRWVVAGEPVVASVLQAFTRRFAPYGFREAMFAPAYGMAESTALISYTPPGNPLRTDWVDKSALQEQQIAQPAPDQSAQATLLISSGIPMPGVEMVIRDEVGQALGERQLGEITTRGDYVFNGYYKNPELTRQVLRDGWLYTGDIGYFAEGYLYVCGRKKDLIIIGGKNYLPEFLEEITARIPSIGAGRSVAFGVMDETKGTESAVLVCEMESIPESTEAIQLEREIRKQIVQSTGLALGALCLVVRGWVVRTPSGKVSRVQSREKYLAEQRQSPT